MQPATVAAPPSNQLNYHQCQLWQMQRCKRQQDTHLLLQYYENILHFAYLHQWHWQCTDEPNNKIITITGSR